MPNAATKKASKVDLRATFAALKSILTPHAENLRVAKDTREWYYLETRDAVWRGKPCMFAAVRLGKAYVSYHLMSVYVDKAVGGKLSPALKKHMQGKSCFQFTAPDENLFSELSRLTAAGAEAFASGKIFEIAAKMTCD